MFDDPGKYLRATGFFKEFISVLSPINKVLDMRLLELF